MFPFMKIMLAIKMVFSITVEAMAENHRVIMAVVKHVSASGFVNEIILSESLEINPT